MCKHTWSCFKVIVWVHIVAYISPFLMLLGVIFCMGDACSLPARSRMCHKALKKPRRKLSGSQEITFFPLLPPPPDPRHGVSLKASQNLCVFREQNKTYLIHKHIFKTSPTESSIRLGFIKTVYNYYALQYTMLFTHCWGLYTSELSEYVILVNSTCHMSGEFYKWCHIWVQQSLKMKSMASLALGGNLLWLLFHLDVWIEYNSWKIRNANNVYRRRTNLAAVLQLNIFWGVYQYKKVINAQTSSFPQDLI